MVSKKDKKVPVKGECANKNDSLTNLSKFSDKDVKIQITLVKKLNKKNFLKNNQEKSFMSIFFY